MRADGSGQKRLTNVSGYDGGPFFTPDGKQIVWRRFDEQGLIADVWTMNLDGTDQQQITDFGSMSWAPYMHPSGAVLHLRVEQARVRELRAVHGRRAGHEGAGARHLLRRLRRPAGAVAGRQDARVDVEPRRRIRRASCSSRSGTTRRRSRRSRTRRRESRPRNHDHEEDETAEHRRARRECSSRRSLRSLRFLPVVVSRADVEDPRARRDAGLAAARRTPRRLERRAARQRLPRRRAAEDRREAAARPDGLPPAVRVHRRHEGRRLVAQPAVRHEERRGQRRRIGVHAAARADRCGRCPSPTTATSTGAVVFAGYGIVVPESQGFGYDSYATLDVKDKIVVVLRYFPEDADQKTHGILARYADLRYKAMAARQHGAKAMIVVTGPRSPNAGELAPMTFDTALAGSGIVAVSVTGDVGERRSSQRAGQDARRRAEVARRRPTRTSTGFALPGITRERPRRGRAREADRPQRRRLPAGDDAGDDAWPSRGSRSARTTITSATAKRATRWPARTTPARSISAPTTTRRDRPRCSPIAATLAKQPRKRQRARRLLVGRGARADRVERVRRPRRRCRSISIAAYLNFDMVGRMQDNKLTVQATGTSPAWAQDHRAGQRRGRLRPRWCRRIRISRPTSPRFNAASVPSLSFFTGTHADYHKPSDTADKIDYEDLDRVVDFAAAIVAPHRGHRRRRRVHEGRSADCSRAAAAPACGSSPARFPTTPPR